VWLAPLAVVNQDHAELLFASKRVDSRCQRLPPWPGKVPVSAHKKGHFQSGLFLHRVARSGKRLLHSILGRILVVCRLVLVVTGLCFVNDFLDARAFGSLGFFRTLFDTFTGGFAGFVHGRANLCLCDSGEQGGCQKGADSLHGNSPIRVKEMQLPWRGNSMEDQIDQGQHNGGNAQDPSQEVLAHVGLVNSNEHGLMVWMDRRPCGS